jgi:hypothetical protein
MLLIFITTLPAIRSRHFNLFYFTHLLGIVAIVIIYLHASTMLYCTSLGFMMWLLDWLMRLYGLWAPLDGDIKTLGKGWYLWMDLFPSKRYYRLEIDCRPQFHDVVSMGAHARHHWHTSTYTIQTPRYANSTPSPPRPISPPRTPSRTIEKIILTFKFYFDRGVNKIILQPRRPPLHSASRHRSSLSSEGLRVASHIRSGPIDWLEWHTNRIFRRLSQASTDLNIKTTPCGL